MARPKTKKPRRAPMPKPESYRRLDEVLAEAQAGVPDKDLAESAGVALDVVEDWRRDRGLVRKGGHRAPDTTMLRAAVNLMGDPDWDVMQRVQSSVLDGRWQLPTYVLRQPLNYDALCEMLYVLHKSFEESQICEALGFTPDTVRQAVVLHQRLLQETKK